MGLFTTRARDLYQWLIAQSLTASLQASSPVDVAAGLAALAKVESNYDQNALGDMVDGVPHAFGYWQINDRVWPFAPARIGDRGYQLERAADVWRQADAAVAAGLKTIGKHKRDGEVVEFTPAKDLPTLYSIAWQYGAGGLHDFVENWDHLTAIGFADYRDFVGKPVYGGRVAFLARCSTFATEYAGWTADPPDFWKEVVAKSAADAAALPAAAADAAVGAGQAALAAAQRKVVEKTDDYFTTLLKKIEAKAIHIAVLIGAAVTLALLSLVAIVYFVKRKPAT